MSIYYFSRLYKNKADFLAEMDENKLNQYVRRSSLQSLRPSEVLHLEHGGYIFEGQMHIQGLDGSYTYGPYAYLHPGYNYMNIGRRVVTVMQFRAPKPGKHEDKRHEKRRSMFEPDDGDHHRTKHNLLEKLLDSKPKGQFGEGRKSGNEMIEMKVLGDRKNPKRTLSQLQSPNPGKQSSFPSPISPPPPPAQPPSKLQEFPKVESIIEHHEQHPQTTQNNPTIQVHDPEHQAEQYHVPSFSNPQTEQAPQQLTQEQYYYLYYMQQLQQQQQNTQ